MAAIHNLPDVNGVMQLLADAAAAAEAAPEVRCAVRMCSQRLRLGRPLRVCNPVPTIESCIPRAGGEAGHFWNVCQRDCGCAHSPARRPQERWFLPAAARSPVPCASISVYTRKRTRTRVLAYRDTSTLLSATISERNALSAALPGWLLAPKDCTHASVVSTRVSALTARYRHFEQVCPAHGAFPSLFLPSGLRR